MELPPSILLKVLRENSRGIESVIIHTTGLKNLHPYGRDIFSKNYHGLIDKHIRLVFTGANKGEIMAKGIKGV